MDIERAKCILEILADGINPVTGEILPSGDSCNQVEVVRAIHAVLRKLDLSASTATKKAQPENAGKPWSPEDDEVLCHMYDYGKSKAEICAYFKRSKGSIAARLVRLEKIKDRSEFR